MKPFVRLYGDPILRAVASQVPEALLNTAVSPVPRICSLMLSTARERQALGIAAQQIGVDYALFAVDMGCVEGYSSGRYWLFANAALRLDGPMVTMREGCLSFDDAGTLIDRPERCVVTASVSNDGGLTWKHAHSLPLKGWQSRIVQHEFDHTIGKLMVDYVPAAFARTLRRRFKAVAV